MQTLIFFPIHSETEWDRFVADNEDALLDMYPSIAHAHMVACQGGIRMGGGAAPVVDVRFVDDQDGEADPVYCGEEGVLP